MDIGNSEYPNDLDREKLENRGIQQDDNYREFMSWITDGGLRYAFAKQNGIDGFYRKQVDEKSRRKVIVIGAGMAGLTAAYELAQVGHEVSILEAQPRIGGRIHTIRKGFAPGLFGEGGAMRIPYNHFLTMHYMKLFQIKIKPFQNFNENAYIAVNGDAPIKLYEWLLNEDSYCTKYWPGWDAQIKKTEGLKEKLKINGIRDYATCSLEKVKQELGVNPSEKRWHAWIDKWGKYSLEEYLKSSVGQTPDEPELRPWPDAAMEAFRISTYWPSIDKDLVLYLRMDLGQFWVDPMYAPIFGMDELPNAFIKKNEKGWNKNVNLSTCLKECVLVKKIELIMKGQGENVKITCKNTHLSIEEQYYGDAVFVMMPIMALKNIDISLDVAQRKALDNVVLIHATKIMLQCRRRFWRQCYSFNQTHGKDLNCMNGNELQGGFTITSDPIGRVFYPDYVNSGLKEDSPGILTVYALQENAVNLGKNKQCMNAAIAQIRQIHPEINDEFEAGILQAWDKDQILQSAFTELNPAEYLESMKAFESTETVYIGGDTFSWSNFWIQGAIFSGLFQAFCFQSRVEGSKSTYNPVTLLR